jgi:hypothetical protein
METLKKAFKELSNWEDRLSPFTIPQFMGLKTQDLYNHIVNVTTYEEFSAALVFTNAEMKKKSGPSATTPARSRTPPATTLLSDTKPKPYRVAPCRNFPDCKWGDKCHYIHPTHSAAEGTAKSLGTSVFFFRRWY